MRVPVLPLLTMASLAIFVWLVLLAVENGREWDAYVAQHNCREVARVWRGGQMQLMPNPAGNGQMTLQWVDQGYAITYHCDNGEITR